MTQMIQGAVDPDQVFFTHMMNADSADMDVDGSETAVTFRLTTPANKLRALSRINFFIKDGGVDPADFGGITGPLDNGITLKLHDADDAVIQDFTNGHPILTNGDWVMLAGTDVIMLEGTGDDVIGVRWSLFKVGAALLMPAGYYMELTVQDDITDLTQFHAMTQGLIFDAI